MIESILTIFIVYLELIGVVSIGALIQLVVYQLTGFSIYNNVWKGLNKLDKILEKSI